MKQVITIQGKAKNVFRYTAMLASKQGKKTLKDLKQHHSFLAMQLVYDDLIIAAKMNLLLDTSLIVCQYEVKLKQQGIEVWQEKPLWTVIQFCNF